MGWIVLGYAVMSAVTFCAYALDKARARRGGWRIAEKTLHGLELLGGWPGALVAQRVVKHKRRKASYMLVFGLIVLAHAAAWGWYLLGPGWAGKG